MYVLNNFDSGKEMESSIGLYYFRGHASKSFTPCASIFRKDNTLPENVAYSKMMLNSSDSFDGKTNFQKLALMQHHGCPTRLLDITTNPLVALYFACLPFSDKNGPTDGKVLIFYPTIPRLKTEEFDAVKFFSALPRLNKQEIDRLKKDLITRKSISSANYPFIYDELKNDVQYRDTLLPIYVSAGKTFPRIKNQCGDFIIASLFNDIHMPTCAEIVISAAYKESILCDLDMININGYFLFPDLDHLANYIKKN